MRWTNSRRLSATDEGWFLRNELQSPPLSFAYLGLLGPYQDELRLLVFYDWGRAWAGRGRITLNNGKAVDYVHLASVGPGLRYQLHSFVSVNADYAWQLEDSGDQEASRWVISAVVSY